MGSCLYSPLSILGSIKSSSEFRSSDPSAQFTRSLGVFSKMTRSDYQLSLCSGSSALELTPIPSSVNRASCCHSSLHSPPWVPQDGRESSENCTVSRHNSQKSSHSIQIVPPLLVFRHSEGQEQTQRYCNSLKNPFIRWRARRQSVKDLRGQEHELKKTYLEMRKLEEKRREGLPQYDQILQDKHGQGVLSRHTDITPEENERRNVQ